MIRALYTAASGLVAQSVKQDVIANNIANAQTAGFKRQRVVSESFSQALENQNKMLNTKDRPNYPDSMVQSMSVSASGDLDPSEGPIRQTGNKLDFAISGPGEFEISTPNGILQTRNGTFRVNASGELCAADGGKVLGQSGPIRIPQGEWSITSDGSVISNGSVVDQIKIVGAQPGKTELLQGSLEEANVNAVREMVDMITNMRSYEANQKVVQSIDRTLDKLINEAGRV